MSPYAFILKLMQLRMRQHNARVRMLNATELWLLRRDLEWAARRHAG